ncbi:MAG: phytoene/squalene synthase family protein [Oscillatoriales cyanobacterium RM2_1_1]|nr:phytoene/squalene synthase family protein [Oscillatoriales cyanobacterium SM2_3_0]NJO44484.1 phytoene/squalene synthase family protein [Oscillatoriales cyanobacterium RM2_1_1]
MDWPMDALEVLQETSRTFYIPISRLPPILQKAVASAYLCMRAIDEIEDHGELDSVTKGKLLRHISLSLQSGSSESDLAGLLAGFSPYQPLLAEVTLRVGEWAQLAPASIAPRIWDATAAMADRMAYWAERNWRIDSELDLDQYTFSVAGAVGLLLSDLWAWYDGTQTNRVYALGFGRGLQAVNIVRNYRDDLKRGVNFFPPGWAQEQMHSYARRNLVLADAYTEALPEGPALDFCRIPLALAHATLDVLAAGHEKLSRVAVVELIEKVSSGA